MGVPQPSPERPTAIFAIASASPARTVGTVRRSGDSFGEVTPVTLVASIPIRLHTLGAVDVRTSEGRAVSGVLAQPKRSAVLFYLALARPRGFHRRDTLLNHLWPEMDDERARAGLRRALHFLRAALGPEVIVGRGDEEIGLGAGQVSCDAWDFDAAMDAGDHERALELYGGDLLAAFHVDDAPDWERWLERERDRVRRRAGEGALMLSKRAGAAGDSAVAVGWARRALEISGEDEGAVKQLLLSLDAHGDRAGALQTYEDFARRLRSEYDAEPAAETQSIIRQVRARSEAIPAHAPESRGDRPVYSTNAVVTRVQPRYRSAWIAGVLLLAIVTIGVMTRGAWRNTRAEALAPERVAVLPFAVHGSSAYAYLAEGIAALLGKNIDGAGSLRTVDQHALSNFLRDVSDKTPALEAGRAVARRFGAGRFILGSVVAAGGRIQISASLYDVSGTPLARAETRALNESEVFALVDNITTALVGDQLSAAGERLGRDAAATTTSVPALKAFLDGEREFRAGRSATAVEAFQRAVDEDSTFALGLYRLSTAALWASQPDVVLDAIGRAMRYLDRLPPRDQLLLRGHKASADGMVSEAERLYGSVVAVYPEDIEAWHQLGELAFHTGPSRGRPLSAARRPFEQVLALDASDVTALLHLARIAAVEKRSGALDSLVVRALALAPAREYALELAALRTFTGRDDGELTRLLQSTRMYPTDPDAYDNLVWLVGWRAATFADNPRAGRDFLRLLTDADNSARVKLLGHTATAHMEAALGRWRAARLELANAARLDPLYAAEVRANLVILDHLGSTGAELEDIRAALVRQRRPAGTGGIRDRIAHGRDYMWRARQPYFVGLLALRLDRTAEVGEAIGDLERIGAAAVPEAELARHFAHQLRARSFWRRGDAAAALREVEAGWPVGNASASIPIFQGESYAQASERFLRAELLGALGRDREALTWYDAIIEDQGFSIALHAQAHLRRARLHRRLGDHSMAIASYDRFIEVWKDADPLLQRDVNAARVEVAAIRRTAQAGSSHR